MGWIVLSLRRNELQASIQDKQMELLQISRKFRNVQTYSSAIGDGKITPSEISGISGELMGDALDFMGYSNDAATEAAMLQTDWYAQAYGSITQQQYANNPNAANGNQLYFDPETGALDTDMMYQEFYEKALEDYAETYIMPQLKELETELENQKTELEAQIESMNAELETVKENISQSIQSSTIKLS